MARSLGRILVVEDEGLVALALEDTLAAKGYEVVGPAPSAAKALSLIECEAIDAALLDVNLGRERVDQVAQALADRAIPFAFSTGHTTKAALPAAFADHKALRKPFKNEELLDTVGKLVAEG